jgi:alkylation response protein AidB-like acyl-CoA dehydrogenase
VSIAITDEHLALATTARRFLEQRCPRAVARAGLDGATEVLPPFWEEMAGLGWLGLHVPEAYGGQGSGLAELAVVLEELGRAAAPGPWLGTVLASAAIVAGGSESFKQQVLPGLANGRLTAAIAFPATARLGGTYRPVPGPQPVDWVIVPAVGGESGERWYAVAAADLSVTELPSLDPTWPGSAVTPGGPVAPGQPGSEQLSGADFDRLVVGLVAAVCAGGAAWCVDTAAAYAGTREQFGRPIGQFQGVKHRCAEMLMVAEQARAVAWDAARTLDQSAAGEIEPEQAGLAASIAGAIAPSAFVDAAKSCIQVLGGIGFTWEHDAHRYLRRAVAIRQLVGGPAKWRRAVCDQALGGARRHFGVDIPAGDEDRRASIRADAERIAAGPASGQRSALVEAGLFVPHWPPPWGRGSGPGEQLIIDQELRRAGLRRPHLAVGAWAAPTIAAAGTPEQQERWVRPTLVGEISWCQLFSEPNAGSDLASLRTTAVRGEGGWVLDGQKVWTSMARQADWGICLARTNPDVPKHAGITYFVVDMHSPGIEIRPLRELTGESMFNEVFLTQVFVPDDGVIGPVDGGWALARLTLGNERVSMGSGSSFGGGIEQLLQLVGQMAPDGPDPVAADGLGALIAEAQTVALLGQRATRRAVAGAGPGPESSVRKLVAAEHDQRTQEFGLGLLGGEGATTEGPAGQWTFGFLANRCLTIAGGTSEVQRNVIAERLLGLPRDPEPAG